MTEIKLRSDFVVELVDIAGGDQRICEAARVSTLGSKAVDTKESLGLIRYLMRSRHGSPFEHGLITFRIEAPIVVWREFMRHRIGFSYNEESGRYKILNGEFYVPPADRPLIQQGKTGEYNFVMGAKQDHTGTVDKLQEAYDIAWESYEILLYRGIAKEVARLALPVATYSTAYVTCNPRSLMAFLSLRTKHEDSTFPSFPQWEINQVADAMEGVFEDRFYLTWQAFQEYGRVAP